jgi:AraC-like DNA-binding protein
VKESAISILNTKPEKKMENWKAYAFLLASGQGLFLSLALLSRVKEKDRSNIFLGLILWVASLELLSAWGMQVDYFNAENSLPFYLLGSYLILPPSIWLFSQFNTRPAFQIRKKHLLLYLPAFFETFVEIGMWVRFKLGGEFISMLNFTPWFVFSEILPIAGIVLALFLYAKSLWKLSVNPKNRDGHIEKLRLIKLWSLFGFLFLLILLWIAGVIIEWPVFGIVELLLSIFLFSLAYLGYFSPSLFHLSRPGPRKSADIPTFPNYENEKELFRLKEKLEQEKLYTRSKLTLEELADELRLPPRYLSQLINNYHNTNFNHFINAYRVEEVMRKIKDPTEQHKTLLAFALEAGFSSKSTFNYAFKKHTGQAPSNFLQNVK